MIPLKFRKKKKDRIKEIYISISQRLDDKLQRKATFEDFINDQIHKFGEEKVEDSFLGLSFVWGLIGRDISNSESVYNNYFTDEANYHYSNEYLMSQTDSIVSNISENPFYQTENISNINDLEVEIEHCYKCGKDYEVGLKDGCPYCREEETSFKKSKGFSFNTALYIGIGLYILYLLSHIQENVLILLLAIVSFGLLYFLDNSK